MRKSPGHPRLIELRLRLDCESEFQNTWRFRLGLLLVKWATWVFGWRAEYFLWDSQQTDQEFLCPCWYSEANIKESADNDF